MRAYKPKYKDRNGNNKVCNEWHLTFNDRAGIRRRLKAYTDKSETVKLGIEIETVMKNNGKLLTIEDKRWFADLMPRIQNKLIGWNVIDGRGATDHLTTPLSEHLKVFIENRKARACDERYIANTESSILRTLAGCGFRMFNDIDGTAVENFLARGRGLNGYGEGTYNRHLMAFKIFTIWLSKKPRLLTPEPMEDTKFIKQVEFRKVRRALTADETDRLLRAARYGKKRGRMTGEARYLVYRLALETGMRYTEIKNLQTLSFSFDSEPPTVRVEADCKGKESATLIMNDSTTAEVKAFLADKEPTDKVFDLPRSTRAAIMIRTDLEIAGIEYSNDAGQDLDFHSLRHTFITDLFLAGVPATVVKNLARHEKLKTTMKYSHVTLLDELAAIRNRRDLTVTCPETIQTRTPVDSGGMKNVG